MPTVLQHSRQSRLRFENNSIYDGNQLLDRAYRMSHQGPIAQYSCDLSLVDFWLEALPAQTLLILSTSFRISPRLFESWMIWANDNHHSFDWMPLKALCGMIEELQHDRRSFRALIVPPQYIIEEHLLTPSS